MSPMSICSSSSSSSSSKSWIVHGLAAGAAITAAIGAHMYFSLTRTRNSQVSDPGHRYYTRSIRVFSLSGQAYCSNPWQAHDPENMGESEAGLYVRSCCTAVTSLKPEDAFDPNHVKCVVDNHGYAIYFSRGLIPFNKSGKVDPNFPYMLHLGIQSYDAEFLKIYPNLEPTPLRLEEDLEQLKVLENGYKMKATKVVHEAHVVDVPDDVEKIDICTRETYRNMVPRVLDFIENKLLRFKLR